MQVLKCVLRSNFFHSDGAPKLRRLPGLIFFFFPLDSYPKNQTAHRADIRRSRHPRRRREGGNATDADGDRVFRRNLRSPPPPDAQEPVDEAEKSELEKRGFLGA